MKFRRSLTLLEVLLVLGLILGMAAVLAPTVLNSLDERAFETAADVTGEQLMLARAHAQATGQSVEVRYRPGRSSVEARFFMPWMLSHHVAASGWHENESKLQMGESNASGSASRAEIAEPWANRSISKSVRIGGLRTASEVEGGLATSSLAFAEAIEAELTNTEDVRLAVFMPDGTALLNDPFWFKDEDGRVGRLTINPFSGLPSWERLIDLTNAISGELDFHSAADEHPFVDDSAGGEKFDDDFDDQPATARPR